MQLDTAEILRKLHAAHNNNAHDFYINSFANLIQLFVFLY
jgi:hypothetical protein